LFHDLTEEDLEDRKWGCLFCLLISLFAWLVSFCAIIVAFPGSSGPVFVLRVVVLFVDLFVQFCYWIGDHIKLLQILFAPTLTRNLSLWEDQCGCLDALSLWEMCLPDIFQQVTADVR